MIVKDIMSRTVIHMDVSSSILDVMIIMRQTNLGFIVITQNEKMKGVITDRDIVLSLSLCFKITDGIDKIMKKDLITINSSSHINDASDLLGNMQIRRLIVVDNNNNLCGILSIADLARHVLLEDNALEAITEISYDYNSKLDEFIQVETLM